LRPANIVDLILGNKSFKDIVDSYDHGVKNIEDMANKIVQSIGPQYKMPVEFLMGEKVFPSIWNRQPITDKWKWLFDNFSLGAFYDKAAGKPQRKDWLKKTIKGAAIYSEDQKRLGWLAVQGRLSEYKKRAGLKGRGFIVTESGSALYNMGLAWRYGDKDAWVKYMAEYVKLTIDKFGKVDILGTMQDDWIALNPLKGLPEIHQKLFLKSLLENKRDRKRLDLALQYYLEIKGGLQFIERGGKK
jgi:hypothetical protein